MFLLNPENFHFNIMVFFVTLVTQACLIFTWLCNLNILQISYNYSVLSKTFLSLFKWRKQWNILLIYIFDMQKDMHLITNNCTNLNFTGHSYTIYTNKNTAALLLQYTFNLAILVFKSFISFISFIVNSINHFILLFNFIMKSSG